MSVERHVYFFGNGHADGSAAMRDILGGKGAGLAEMANLGLPVPPGFTLSAKLCIAYLEHGTFPPALRAEVDRHLKHLERVTKKGFGDAKNPLLVSVRSGAAVSMPGMMETILNLGLNDAAAAALAEETGDARFACRCDVRLTTDVVAPGSTRRRRTSSCSTRSITGWAGQACSATGNAAGSDGRWRPSREV